MRYSAAPLQQLATMANLHWCREQRQALQLDKLCSSTSSAFHKLHSLASLAARQARQLDRLSSSASLLY